VLNRISCDSDTAPPPTPGGWDGRSVDIAPRPGMMPATARCARGRSMTDDLSSGIDALEKRCLPGGEILPPLPGITGWVGVFESPAFA